MGWARKTFERIQLAQASWQREVRAILVNDDDADKRTKNTMKKLALFFPAVQRGGKHREQAGSQTR